jgi:hypothetical protein
MKTNYKSSFLFLIVLLFALLSCQEKKTDTAKSLEPIQMVQSEIPEEKQKTQSQKAKILQGDPDALFGTIDFSLKNWQLIASSQNYGTNYAVYGFFETNKKNTVIENVTLKMVNYKSKIGVGIKDFCIIQKGKDIKIEILVQALTSNNKEVGPKKCNIKFSKDNDNTLTTERILLPMFEISKAKYDQFDANEKKFKFLKKYSFDGTEKIMYSEPYVKFSLKEKTELNKYLKGYPLIEIAESIFDYEFYYKNGNKILPKHDYDENLFDGTQGPGFTCRKGVFKIR